MSDFESSVKMIEQKFLMVVLENLIRTIIIAICFSNTELKYNYINREYDRLIKKIIGKTNLRSATEEILLQCCLYLPFLERNKEFIQEVFYLAFEKALAMVLVEGYIKQEEEFLPPGRKIYQYSITPLGIDHYTLEIKPVFSGLFNNIKSLRMNEAEKKGIERWLK